MENGNDVLRAMALTGSLPSDNNAIPTVIVQPASYAAGCGPKQGLSPSPASTLLVPQCAPDTCQVTITLTKGKWAFGLGVTSFAAQQNLVTRGILPTGISNYNPDGTSNNSDLAFYNEILDCVGTLWGCRTYRVIGTASALPDAQLAQPELVACIDVNKPLQSCPPVPTYPNCADCVNQPVNSISNPIYGDCTHGFAYEVLADSVLVTLTVIANARALNYVPC